MSASRVLPAPPAADLQQQMQLRKGHVLRTRPVPPVRVGPGREPKPVAAMSGERDLRRPPDTDVDRQGDRTRRMSETGPFSNVWMRASSAGGFLKNSSFVLAGFPWLVSTSSATSSASFCSKFVGPLDRTPTNPTARHGTWTASPRLQRTALRHETSSLASERAWGTPTLRARAREVGGGKSH